MHVKLTRWSKLFSLQFIIFHKKLAHTKLNKTQTKRENVTVVKYFHDIWSFVCIKTVSASIFFIFYPIFILLPHYLPKLTFFIIYIGWDTDAIYVNCDPLGGTPLPPPPPPLLPILHPIHQGRTDYFIGRSLEWDGDGDVFWSQPLILFQGWDIIVCFQYPHSIPSSPFHPYL